MVLNDLRPHSIASSKFPAISAASAILANVGVNDVAVTFTVGTTSGVTGTLAGVFSIDYTARNVDGSIIAYGSGYTNS